ncbi:MAG: flagellar motor switch protein FliG [Terriglobia bacterium]
MADRAGVLVSGLRKAAILMMALGDKPSSEILRSLASEDVRRIAGEIAVLQAVPQETSLGVLEEFEKLAAAQEYMALGGADYAAKLLEAAFGDVEAKRLLDQALRARITKTVSVTDLSKSDPKQLAKLIEEEQPQTVALILAQMGAKVSSALLPLLPEGVRGTVIERLARMGELSGDTVESVLGVLQSKFDAIGKHADRLSYGGVNTVVGILNQMDPLASKAILESIEQADPSLAVAIRDVLFTFEDLLTVPERGIRECLGSIDKKTLAIALKGASEDLRGHIMKCMSSRAAEMLKEDMDALGPVRMRDVAKAQGEIVNALRALEAEGKISLRNEEQDALVV